MYINLMYNSVHVKKKQLVHLQMLQTDILDKNQWKKKKIKKKLRTTWK